jgi:hypothetical protein
MASGFEILMLICFGVSWPLALVKNIRAKTANGMHLLFICLIVIGYIAGITAKILNNIYGIVFIAYIVNLVIVSLNIPVYFLNKRYDRVKEQCCCKCKTITARRKKCMEKNIDLFLDIHYLDSIDFQTNDISVNKEILAQYDLGFQKDRVVKIKSTIDETESVEVYRMVSENEKSVFMEYITTIEEIQ